MQKNTFLIAFLQEILKYVYQTQNNNTDSIRFPQHAGMLVRTKRWLKEALLMGGATLGFVYTGRHTPPYAQETLNFIIANEDLLNEAYTTLSDEMSRRQMVCLFAYRTLGPQRVKLPRNTASYWMQVQHIKRTTRQQPRTFSINGLGYLDLYDLQSMRFPIRLHAHLLNILCTFALQQYAYCQPGTSIHVEAGDIVIDGGGCWGDTALYFAHKAGSQGQVYSFEFAPDNLKIFRQNLAMNILLASRIRLVPEAMWNVSGEHFVYQERGPGTSLALHQASGATAQVQTRSLDDFVQAANLPRVDFIKMDIEGAELQALKGAEQTLRTFRPKLAIAAYHKIDDIITLTRYLHGLRLGYQFFLDHFTIHNEETVLFAQPT